MADPWRPSMFMRQFDVFNVGITLPPVGDIDLTPCVLVCGPRFTGKTIAIVNRIIRHLWETQGARAAVFSKTIKVAKDGGIWEDILDGMREWLAAGIVGKTGQRFEYTSKDARGNAGPRLDSQTRTISFKIRNWHGGESELKLFSLEHDHEVEAKVKSTRFSLMWFSELSLYQDRQVFSVSRKQLRMKHLKPWQHLWIADTNPHEDGEGHWIYQQWYVDRIRTEDSFRTELQRLPAIKRLAADKFEEAVRKKLAYRKALKLIEIFLDDNTFLDEGQRLALEEEESVDPGQFARNVEGKWVRGHGNVGKHFSGLFFEDLHVIGSEDSNVGDSIDILPSTMQMITSWDTGDINHSAHILERRLINERSYWMIHDECISIGERLSTPDFAREMLERIQNIEGHYTRKFDWTHYSDSSADIWRSFGEGSTGAMEIESATGGLVKLEMVLKPKHSVRSRVKLLKLLLKQNRIFVAKRCRATMEMFYNCSKGKAETEYVIENEHKHPFDSLTYAIYMEALKDPDPEFYSGNPRPRSVNRDVMFL